LKLPAKQTLAVAFATLAACLGASACGGGESQQEAEQHLCSSLQDFSASISGLQTLSLQSSSEDVKNELDKIDEAWGKVVGDAKDVKNASTADLESAYDGLKQAIQDRPKDKPIAEVVAGIQTKFAAFTQALGQLTNGLSCKTSS
jgi:hypothetical protein